MIRVWRTSRNTTKLLFTLLVRKYDRTDVPESRVDDCVQIGLCELANDRHRKPVKQTNRVSVERELYTNNNNRSSARYTEYTYVHIMYNVDWSTLYDRMLVQC